MLPQRFSVVSVIGMIGTTVLAVIEVLRVRGVIGFAAHQGFPFKWYWYTDLTMQYNPGYGYSWRGLAIDIVLWFLVVLAVGLFIEFIVRRLSRKHDFSKMSLNPR